MRQTVIVEGAPRIPGAVLAELERRRGVLLDGFSGRVLDLSEPSAREIVRKVIDGEIAEVSADWDLVLSTAELIRFPDLPAALRAIDQLLAPRGRLVAIEPVVRPGTLRAIASAPWSSTKWVSGFHLGRDLVAAVRTTTLMNDDIDRFTLPTAVVPWRQFVSLGARRVEPISEEVL